MVYEHKLSMLRWQILLNVQGHNYLHRNYIAEMIQTILEVVGKMCSCEESSITMHSVLQDLINNRFANEAKRFLLDLPHKG